MIPIIGGPLGLGPSLREVAGSSREEAIGVMGSSNKSFMGLGVGRCPKDAVATTPMNLGRGIATIFKGAGSSMAAEASLKEEEVGGRWKCQGAVGPSIALSALSLCCRTSRHKLISCPVNIWTVS